LTGSVFLIGGSWSILLPVLIIIDLTRFAGLHLMLRRSWTIGLLVLLAALTTLLAALLATLLTALLCLIWVFVLVLVLLVHDNFLYV